MRKVKFGDVVNRVNIYVDRFNTERLYYVGKGGSIEPNALDIKPQAKIEGATIGFKFHFGFNPGHILFMSRCFDQHKAATATFAGVCSDSTYVVETRDESVLMQRYLQLVMQTDDFWGWCEEHKSGGVNFLINYSTLETYEFDLPSLDEQKVLADKLWAAYRVKESYRKLLVVTDDMVKAKFVEMFDYRPLDLSGNTANFDKYCKDFTSKAEKIPAGDYQQSGKYAIFDQSQDSIIAGYTDREDGVCTNFPVVLFGDHSRSIKYIDEPYYIGADGVKIVQPTTENIIPKFLYYDLLYHEIPNTGYNRHFKYLKMIHLTEATLEEQQQFVDIATQAEATKASLRQSIESIDRVIKSLINQ